MAKNAVTDWDVVAANNTDVGGTSIAEGCAPSSMNDMGRTIMAQVAAFQQNPTLGRSSSDAVTVNAGTVSLVNNIAFQRALTVGATFGGFYSTTYSRYGWLFGVANDHNWNVATAANYAGRDTVTGRSINAGGTVNASGADYAEYMTKAAACGAIAAGDICGVDADGLLTDQYANAHSFVTKSTDPAYVGGDTWGLSLGERPSPPVAAEGEEVDPLDQAAYEAELAAFEAALEAERQKVDRIAFAGQVPVNVTGATPGQFLIAREAPDGGIYGEPVDEPSLVDLFRVVGKVWKVLPDGRAWVAVKVA